MTDAQVFQVVARDWVITSRFPNSSDNAAQPKLIQYVWTEDNKAAFQMNWSYKCFKIIFLKRLEQEINALTLAKAV